MSTQKPSKQKKIPEGPPYEFYHYPDLYEAEIKSADIGFPLFSCEWIDDGTILLGGGGGSRGMGVRSSIVAARLVDGEAVDNRIPTLAYIDPLQLSTMRAGLPAQPMIQAVGEMNTDDDIVLSMKQYTTPSSTVIASSVGCTTLLLDIHGFGTLAASPIPACMNHGQTIEELASETISFLPHQQRPSSTRHSNSQYTSGQALTSIGSSPSSKGGRASATAASPMAALPFSSPFKSPLLSQLQLSSHSNISTALLSLSKDGKRRMNSRIRFRTDFCPKAPAQSHCVLTPDGRVLITGGSDGVIRAFIIAHDPDLMSTLVTSRHGQDSIVETPSKNQPRLFGYVSPLMLPIGFHPEGVVMMNLTHDGRYVAAVSEDGNAAVWTIPSFEMIIHSGKRIPIDYLDDKGYIREEMPYPPRTKAGCAIDPSHLDLSTSYGVAFHGVSGLQPAYILPRENGLVFRQALFWSPPVLDRVANPVPLLSNSTGIDKQKIQRRMLKNHIRRTSSSGGHTNTNGGKYLGYTDDDDDDGSNDSDDDDDESNYIQSYTGGKKTLVIEQDYSATLLRPSTLEEQLHGINTHVSRNPNHYTLLTLVSIGKSHSYLCKWSFGGPDHAQTSVPHHTQDPMKQGSLRLVTRVEVCKDGSANQMILSPNGHFIAITGNDFMLFTGPDIPYVRTCHMLAAGIPCTTNLSSLPPLTLMNRIPGCFEIGCTSLAFDPTSRVVMGVSALRAVYFLPVKVCSVTEIHKSKLSKCCNRITSLLCCSSDKPSHRRCGCCCCGPQKRKRSCMSSCGLTLLNCIIILSIMYFLHIFVAEMAKPDGLDEL